MFLSRLCALSILGGALALGGCGGSATTALPGQPFNASSVHILGHHYNVLYRFLGSMYGAKDGSSPERHLNDRYGTIYGTTFYGGINCRPGGCGTVFKMTLSGGESVLYRFRGGADGAYPSSGLVSVNGIFYGTTSRGGLHDNGTIFTITPGGLERVLHRFKGQPDGAHPQAGFTVMNGTLYGTTADGGRYGAGAVFKITASGQESVIYNFGTTYNDGYTPWGSLTSVKSVLYGTTKYGGRHCHGNAYNGCGTVFQVTPSGTERVIYGFRGAISEDGDEPLAGVTPINGALYGTTLVGGYGKCANGKYPHAGCGVAFKVTFSGKETVLHRFTGGVDGIFPEAGLAFVNGSYYGTTSAGGSSGCGGYGCGTIFKIAQSGETITYVFNGSPDGASPEAGLTDVAGILYGTTAAGGGSCGGSPSGCGTVFRILP